MDSSRIQYVLKAGQEILIVPLVPEDPAPLNSPGHDVLEKVGGIESWLARHGLSGYLVGLVHLVYLVVRRRLSK